MLFLSHIRGALSMSSILVFIIRANYISTLVTLTVLGVV